MESKTLNGIKTIYRLAQFILLYFIIYNTYFGWNMHPINEYEKYCDMIFQGLFGLLIGKFIHTILTFMQLVVNYIKSETIKNKKP